MAKKKPGRKPGLKPMQLRALDHYYGFANFNKTKAMEMAGYGSPNKYLSMFDIPYVKKEMERREARYRERYEVTFKRVQDEIAKVAYFNPLCVLAVDKDGLVTVDITQAEAAEMAAISEIKVTERTVVTEDGPEKVTTVKVKPWNKVAALDLLMRHAGLSKEKSPLEGLGDLADRINAGLRRVAVPEEKEE